MAKKQYVVDMITEMTGNAVTSEMIVDRLIEEGLLVLGYGEPDIESIVVAFTEAFGTTKVSRYDRFAANRLASKYGSQAVCGVIKLLAASRQEKFAPVVGNVTQLEAKWVNVLNFLRNIKTDETITL